MLRILRSPLARSPKVQPHKDEPAKKPRRSDMDHPLTSLDAGGGGPLQSGERRE